MPPYAKFELLTSQRAFETDEPEHARVGVSDLELFLCFCTKPCPVGRSNTLLLTLTGRCPYSRNYAPLQAESQYIKKSLK